mgnify:CR=1 FL=1
MCRGVCEALGKVHHKLWEGEDIADNSCDERLGVYDGEVFELRVAEAEREEISLGLWV